MSVIVALRDLRADYFSKPLFFSLIGEAKRSFISLLDDKSGAHPASKSPADFALFELGSYNDVTGVISMLPQPILIMNGSEFSHIESPRVTPVDL